MRSGMARRIARSIAASPLGEDRSPVSVVMLLRRWIETESQYLELPLGDIFVDRRQHVAQTNEVHGLLHDSIAARAREVLVAIAPTVGCHEDHRDAPHR